MVVSAHKLFLPLKVHIVIDTVKRMCLFNWENSHPVIVPSKLYISLEFMTTPIQET